MVWYSHLFKNFPQFVMMHTIKGFCKVNKVEVDVFLELSCFFDDQMDVGNFISGSTAFSKIRLNLWKFIVPILLKPVLENFEQSNALLLGRKAMINLYNILKSRDIILPTKSV